MGRFWFQKQVPRTVKRSVFGCVVQISLLSGQEAEVHHQSMLDRFDTFMGDKVRRSLGGWATTKFWSQQQPPDAQTTAQQQTIHMSLPRAGASRHAMQPKQSGWVHAGADYEH